MNWAAAPGIYLVWGLGGVVALCGALSFSELGFRFPQAGGVYVYLKEAYGSLVAFLYGWIILTVITSGAIAALAIAFARYVDVLIPLGDRGIQFLGIAAVLVLTMINIRGIRYSDWFARGFTGVKLLGIAIIILVAVAYNPGGFVESQESEHYSGLGWSAFALALIGVFWSYGGWHHASYLAAETRNPTKTVPRAMVMGAIVVALAYLLINGAYLSFLSVDEMSQSSAVASDALERVSGLGAEIIAILIAISTFGTAGNLHLDGSQDLPHGYGARTASCFAIVANPCFSGKF